VVSAVAIVVLVLIILVAAGALVRLGYVWAVRKFGTERVRLDSQRQALSAEWRALDDTRRIRAVFLAARHAMHDEARQHGTGGTR
jgi:cell division protein FtsL